MAIFKLTSFPSVVDLQQKMADGLALCFQTKGASPFAVMLSGGKTPLGIYEILVERGVKASAQAHILYSDERHVPDSSDENNYHHTVALLQSLGIPASRVMRVHTGQSLERAASQYHQELLRFLSGGGRIAWGLLGIGADGHTASLFSFSDIERGKDRFAVAIPHEPKPDRISVTPDLLARVDRLMILATGSEKDGIIEKLLRRGEEVVTGRALREVPEVEIWKA